MLGDFLLNLAWLSRKMKLQVRSENAITIECFLSFQRKFYAVNVFTVSCFLRWPKTMKRGWNSVVLVSLSIVGSRFLVFNHKNRSNFSVKSIRILTASFELKSVNLYFLS